MKKTLTAVAAFLCAVHGAVSSPSADSLVASDPPRYIVEATGKRLNSFISRDIVILAKEYAATGDKKYLDSAVRYMKAAGDYPDWRAREHYLSASYIVDAFADAFDLCGEAIGKADREYLEKVLVKKGLNPTLGHWFWHVTNNWTQACCASVAHAALALEKSYPSLTASYLPRCVEATRKTVAYAYGPDGCYAEGPGYWKFATDKTRKMIEVLKRSRGEDYGLSDIPGYKESFEWFKEMHGPTGEIFNYSDGDLPRTPPSPWNVKETSARIFRGVQPVGIVKGRDFFLAVKGGRANLNHAHMDAGSFVYETVHDGKAVRWVIDPGSERYRRIERAGIAIWNFSQHSTRWGVFRHGPFSHSTFTIDSLLHDVDGNVELSKGDGKAALKADMSGLYRGIWKSAEREWSVNTSLAVRDSFKGVSEERTYVFNFCTKASVKIDGNRVVLESQGRKLVVCADTPGSWSVENVSKPRKSYECPNRGVSRVVFTKRLPPGDSSIGLSFTF